MEKEIGHNWYQNQLQEEKKEERQGNTFNKSTGPTICWSKKCEISIIITLIVLLLLTNPNNPDHFGKAYFGKEYRQGSLTNEVIDNRQLFSIVSIIDGNGLSEYKYTYLGILGIYLRTEAQYIGPREIKYTTSISKPTSKPGWYTFTPITQYRKVAPNPPNNKAILW